MSGMLFVVCIPTEKHENSLRKPKTLSNEYASPKDVGRKKNKQFGKKLEMIEDDDDDDSSRPSLESQEALITRRSHSTDSVTIHVDDDKIKEPVDSTSTLKKTRSFESLDNKDSLQPIPDNSVSAIKKSWEGIKELVVSGKKDRSTGKKKIEEEDDDTQSLMIAMDSSMEVVLKEIIQKTKLKNAVWTKSDNFNNFQIMFTIESGDRSENILRLLGEWGIGEREGSSVSLMPCTIYHKPHLELNQFEEGSQGAESDVKENAWDRFIASIRARLNVAQIVEEVTKDAQITFDFFLLVIIAAILAAFGLIEDSTIFLASSMLISPLMGPIIAAIFGTVIKDSKLTKMGIKNELIGICLATFVGFVFGLIEIGIDEEYGDSKGVTAEMDSRCTSHALVVGIFTALPSGAAVAIAILGDNIGSLVGVAISASLLPPAVNAGLLWALSFIYAVFESDDSRYNFFTPTKYYSDNQSIELALMGAYSMAVTFSNVICIYVMGVLVLKIKEVAPIASKAHRHFWKHDIKIARDYYKTCQSEDAQALSKKLADEIAGFQKQDHEIGGGSGYLSHQNTWSPMSTRNFYSFKNSSKPTIQELEALYLNRMGSHKEASRPIAALRRESLIMRNISPPKYRSFPEDNFFEKGRRASQQVHEIGTAGPSTSKYSFHMASTSGRGTNLDKITEISSNDSNLEEKPKGFLLPTKSSRKFTVTPALDPLLEKE